MGNALLKPVTNVEKLDRLMETISCQEELYFLLQHRKEIWIENVVAYGIGLYFLLGGLMYALRAPSAASDGKSYVFCYVLYPVLLIMVKELMNWIFNLRLDNTAFKINCLRSERKEIMDTMMRTEPFKTFKCCLDQSQKPDDTVRQKRALSKPVPVPVQSLRPCMPAPVPHSQKGPLDRFFEFIVGEGCCYRFALICSKCSSHNGMALREEYDYISFQCYNCRFLNPARKSRPISPRLGTRDICMGGYDDEDVTDDEVRGGKTKKPQLSRLPFRNSSTG